MSWTTPGELRAQVQAWWDKGKILAELAGGEAVFPRRLTFITPCSGEIAEQFDAVRRWIQTLSTMPQVRFVERDFRHRLFGNNSLPSEAWIDSAEAAIALLGKRNDAANFRQMLATTASTQPTLLPWLQKRPLRALEHHANWQRLLAVVGWLQAHPRPGIYIRQVDLSDIDSKFIESQRALLGELLDLALPAEAIDPGATGLSGFNRRYGFRDKPERIRCRFLDPRCAPLPWLAEADLTLDAISFAAFDPPVGRVFITENEVNFLAFPPVEGSLLIFGAGYGFSALHGATWLHAKAIHYWGDVDTHGFAILDQLRRYFPHVRSLLMDEDTLHACRSVWGREPNPTTQPLHHLHETESTLYRLLSTDALAPALRLEQERIPLHHLQTALDQL